MKLKKKMKVKIKKKRKKNCIEEFVYFSKKDGICLTLILYLFLILTVLIMLGLFFGFCLLNLLSVYQIISIKNTLFDEIIDDIKSSIFQEPREKNFYKRLTDETFRTFPELEIFLVGQFLSKPFLDWLGIKWTNLICYFVNSICLGFLILFYSLNNLNDLNKHYTIYDDIILIIIWVFIYISTSISSLVIYDFFLKVPKKFIIEYCLDSKQEEKKENKDRILNSGLFFFDGLLKAVTYFIKIKLNEYIYKKFDYSINKPLFLFSYFLIYNISGIIPILFMTIMYTIKEKKDKIFEKEMKEIENHFDGEEIELLVKVDESTVNFFGNISQKHKRKKETQKKKLYLNNEFDIKIIDIKEKVQKKDINNFINPLLKDNKITEKELNKLKNDALNEALNNIIERKSPFRLVYETEGTIKYLLKFIKRNKLNIFLILYFIYNLTSMNFYNIIEENYLRKKKLEFLKSRYYEYLLIIICVGFLIGIFNFIFNKNIYYQISIIYIFLLICNFSLINFYALKLFKNYYDYNKKKSDDMDLHIIQLFLYANLYNFIIQNIYIEKEGNDYLSINAIIGVVDFFYIIIEFIIYEMIKNGKLLNIINYISFFVSSIVELYLLVICFVLFFLYLGSDCKCCENVKKKFKHFLQWLNII